MKPKRYSLSFEEDGSSLILLSFRELPKKSINVFNRPDFTWERFPLPIQSFLMSISTGISFNNSWIYLQHTSLFRIRASLNNSPECNLKYMQNDGKITIVFNLPSWIQDEIPSPERG